MLLWVISTLLSLSHYSVFQQQDLIYHVPLLKKERKLLINMWKALWGTLGIREENLNFLKFFFFFFFNVDHFLSPYCIYFWFYYCFFGCKLCRILALQLGIEPDPPALETKPQPSHYQEVSMEGDFRMWIYTVVSPNPWEIGSRIPRVPKCMDAQVL